jgi:hypothetical protein
MPTPVTGNSASGARAESGQHVEYHFDALCRIGVIALHAPAGERLFRALDFGPRRIQLLVR